VELQKLLVRVRAELDAEERPKLGSEAFRQDVEIGAVFLPDGKEEPCGLEIAARLVDLGAGVELVAGLRVFLELGFEDAVLEFVDAQTPAKVREESRFVGRDGLAVLPRDAEDEVVKVEVAVPGGVLSPPRP
jgi:hypothetical protein